MAESQTLPPLHQGDQHVAEANASLLRVFLTACKKEKWMKAIEHLGQKMETERRDRQYVEKEKTKTKPKGKKKKQGGKKTRERPD